jgi:prevent-host-death family protein
MRVIPQRELRNNSSAVLRRAEAGEQFVITVDGRPVATLGPYARRQWVAAAVINEILATPTDTTMLDDLASFDSGQLQDPWERP